MRAALALSAAAFALAGSGAAFAGDCTAPVGNVVHCNGDFTDTIHFAVDDLTLVVGDESPSTIVVQGLAQAIGIDAYSGGGDVAVASAAAIYAIAYGDARGISAASGDGNVMVTNTGDMLAGSLFLDAIGIYAYSHGDVGVENDGYVAAVSLDGLADGIFASGANVDVSNGANGEIVAAGVDWAAGIEAQGSDSVAVSNAGSIGVQTYGVGEAFGIYAGGGAGGATVDNSGLVQVRGYDAATGIYATANGDIDVSSSGYVLAGYVEEVGGNTYSSSYASGILALSGTDGAAITIDNSGLAYAASFSGSSGIEARSLGVGGSVAISSSGDVIAAALATGGSASGIAASAAGDSAIENSGSVYAFSGGMAYGAIALSFNGDASVANSGDIDAVNTAFRNYSAYGIVSASQNGSASAGNSGNIHVYSPYIGAGMEVGGLAGASASNSGGIAADAWVSYGIRAGSGQGDVAIDNSGDIAAYYTGTYIGYSFGMHAETAAGDIAIDNSGDISSEGGRQSIAVFATTTAGDIAIDNGGSVESTGLIGLTAGIFATNTGGDVSVGSSGDVQASSYVGTSVGIFARATAGTGVIETTGDIESAATYGHAYGVLARGAYLDASNTGDITATAYYMAFGAYLDSSMEATFRNSGAIETHSDAAFALGAVVYADLAASAQNAGGGRISAEGYYGIGLQVVSTFGDATIANMGDIEAYGGAMAIGASARAYAGTYPPPPVPGDDYYEAIAKVTNTGSISAVSPGDAMALNVNGPNVDVSNSGQLQAQGNHAAGVISRAEIHGEISNSGHIVVHGDMTATGISAAAGYSVAGLGTNTIRNSGAISAMADSGAAIGVAVARGGTLVNSGTITASGGATAIGASLYSGTLVNSGTISAQGGFTTIGVAIGAFYGSATVENHGIIRAQDDSGHDALAIASFGGLDLHNAGRIYGGIVSMRNDVALSIDNGEGGLWSLDGTVNPLGLGDDAITNQAGGIIRLSNAAIAMGGSGAAGNSFENAGTIRTSDFGLIDMGTGPTALVPSLNPLPLVNNGIIDFVDGAPDDMLVILGDLGGDGAINLDVSLLNGTSDLLYVDGSVVDGTTQAINLAIDGMPSALASDPVAAVAVSGNVAANAFVGGQVLNFDPSNFLDLGVALATSPQGGMNVVSASVAVTGLNDTGVLAASVASGAHSLVNSSIGTLRQRMGMAPEKVDGQAGLSPWIRVFTDKGDIAPHATGFGSGSDFGFEQENRGREFGMNVAFGNGFNLGILAGNADGTQDLTGATGNDRLKLRSSGIYATWMAPRFYVDASWRWMDFDARMLSAVGEQDTSGNAEAFNVEAGYTAWNVGGMRVVPQAQYTRSKIDNVEVVQGSLAGFAIDGGVSERGRLGVAIDRSFAGAGGIAWTPYGAVSAVREFDGASRFTVADAFTGGTDTEGTSSLVELGIGAQKGGFSATAGVNWTDGGALDSFVGGQLVVRYTW